MRPTPIAALDRATAWTLRGGLVLIIAWIGLFKFTPTEARAIQPLLVHSPVLGWVTPVLGVQGASNAIGGAELVIAMLLAVGAWWPRAGLAGATGGVAMFLTTLSFLFTTPDTWKVVDGLLIPASGGFFLLKDLVLLGGALWCAQDAARRLGRPA
jgi:uncharacterized membrane protein YkgB